MNMKSFRSAALAGATVLIFGFASAGIALAGSAPAGTPAGQAEKGTNTGGTKKASGSQPVALAELSAQLLDYGRATKDPVALALSAKMIKQAGKMEPGPKPSKSSGAAASAKKASPPGITAPDKILAEARTMAHGDKTVIAMIDDVAKMQTKGVVGGPKYDVSAIDPHSTVYYDDSFYGESYAEVGISGDGDSDLDLYVYDQNGNLVCSSTTYGDDEYCGWTPRWTGQFRVKVVNTGGIANGYAILTN